MSQQFNSIKVGSAGRSTFDLSHHQVTTSDFGYIIPICVRDMVPNDDYVVTPSLFCRLAPLAYPAYGRVQIKVSSFFVPYRILYPDWDAFLTGSQATNTIPPFATVDDLSSLIDIDPQFNGDTESGQPRGIYTRIMSNLGLNPELIQGLYSSYGEESSNERISMFRFLAYYRIWMDWFMDSNIYDHSVMVKAFDEAIKNGGRLYGSFLGRILQYRCACFGKDYFTTAKLHPQAGANPSSISTRLADSTLNPALTFGNTASNIQGINSAGVKVKSTQGNVNVANDIIANFTVEELRAAVSLQRYLERNNYVGSKIINQLLVHFGIAPSPERLDMSEYLGGSSFPVQIGDVTSTTPDLSGSGPQTIGLGAQAGKGVAASQTETIRYHAKEHGVFMTLMYIMPDTSYYQCLHKQWQLGVKGDPLDYYTPEFENLGFQEILNKEVYIPRGNEVAEEYQEYDPDGIFGYAPRYAFLKWQPDCLAGDFLGLSSPSVIGNGSLDAWHLFRTLRYTGNNPLALNSNFVELDNHNNSFDRIFQIVDTQYDHFYFNIDVDVKATRPMVGFMEPSVDENNRGDGNTINLPYGGTRL